MSICDTFWVQNHTSLLVKNVEGRGGFEYLWHLLGFKITIDYRPKNSKKCRFGEGALEHLWHLLASKFHKKVDKALDIIGVF